jgi:predicted CXXCH cytochrome family protein
MKFSTANALFPRPAAAGWRAVFWLLAGGLALAGDGVARAQNPSSILGTKHNLSASGPGDLRAASEKEVCIFCHAPHHATTDGPLWNHQMSVASYTPYNSSTLKATVGQPTGSSKLCLSCHDGTVALGMVYNRFAPITMQSGVGTIPSGRATRLGTDLSAHHPVSFDYNPALVSKNGELRDPGTLPPAVRLEGGQMQCTSCHDAHDNQYGNFLVMDNIASALCLQCHAPSHWDTSDHATSLATWNGSGPNPWPHTGRTTVAANACEGCHNPHAAATPKRLLNFATPEDNCYSCHSGTVAAKNIALEFGKISIHPITVNAAVHDPTEDIINPPRHVVCADCHNPHAAKGGGPALAPAATGALAGVRGVNAAGTEVLAVANEYELCFRCHGDSTARGAATVPRLYPETDTRVQFDPGYTSFHPIEAAGKNTGVPSLIQPNWTTASLMYCTDCHNNDQGPNTGGSGPNGPHGSVYAPLLERRLLFTDGTTYNPANFALCYKCHDSAVVDSDLNTSWQYHREHIETFKAACTTCHDSHASTQPHLINFNTTYVLPYNGVTAYVSTGPNRGNCTLTCHDGNGVNQIHAATSY